MEITLESQQIRNLLQNAGKIKKDGVCIYCQGTGWTNWNEDGEDEKPGYSADINRNNEECDECQGVGYMF